MPRGFAARGSPCDRAAPPPHSASRVPSRTDSEAGTLPSRWHSAPRNRASRGARSSRSRYSGRSGERLPVSKQDSRREYSRRQHLQTVHDTRARAAEVCRSVQHVHLGREVTQQVVVALSFATRLLEIEAAWHDQQDIGIERSQLRPFHPVRRPARGPRHEVAARRGDELGHPVSRDIRRIEPLECEDARTRSIRDRGAHRADAPLHIGDAILGLLHCSGRATDVANAREDGSEVMRVECENPPTPQSGNNGSDELTLRYRTNVADPLREYEIGLERLESSDVDLIHAAMIAQRR